MRRARLAATGKPIVLSVRNLTKTYRSAGEQVAVLRGVEPDVAAGERVALTGESGSGKSTLLHLIAGLDRPMAARSGSTTRWFPTVRCRPRGIARDRLGLVFQQFNLIPSLNVRGQSRVSVAHRRPSRCGLASRAGGAARARQFAQALSRAIVRRPAAARRDRPRAGGQNRCCCSPTSPPAISTRRPRTTCWRCARSGRANRLRLPDGDPQRAARRHAGPPGQSARRGDRMSRALWILAVLLSHWRRHPMQLATLLIG
jgi:putative ABC transport system ATP-binding protein